MDNGLEELRNKGIEIKGGEDPHGRRVYYKGEHVGTWTLHGGMGWFSANRFPLGEEEWHTVLEVCASQVLDNARRSRRVGAASTSTSTTATTS